MQNKYMEFPMAQLRFDPEYKQLKRNDKKYMRKPVEDYFAELMESFSLKSYVGRGQQAKVLATEVLLQKMGLDVVCVESIGCFEVVNATTHEVICLIDYRLSVVAELFKVYDKGDFDSVIVNNDVLMA